MSNDDEGDKKSIASILAAAGVALLITGTAGQLAGAAAAIAAILGWKKLSKANQYLIDSIPEDVKLYLPVVLLARDQMVSDINRSPLTTPLLLKKHNEEIQQSLNLLAPGEHMVRTSAHIARIKSDRIWGKADSRDVAMLAEMDQSSVKLKVDCQSICVGAYAAFVSMKKRYGASFSIDPGAASGRETALTKGYQDDDILVTADAPMLLGAKGFRFEKMLPVTSEVQSVLMKKGMHHHSKPSIFVYPLSSVEHQLMCMAEQNADTARNFQFPTKPLEVPIEDLSDYIVLDQVMKPGDYVIAWDPLRTSLLSTELFDEVPNSKFDLPLSLFVSETTKFDREHIDSFLRLFIAEIANVCSSPQAALNLLLLDKSFRQSLTRGAAMKLNLKTY